MGTCQGGFGLDSTVAERGSGRDGGSRNQKHDVVVKKANIAPLTDVSRVAAYGGSYSFPLGTDEAAAGKKGSVWGTAL